MIRRLLLAVLLLGLAGCATDGFGWKVLEALAQAGRHHQHHERCERKR